jgi:glycosyltransferase involved in cell wall biosynthesis
MIRPEFGGIASPENEPEPLQELISRYIGDPQRVEREGAAARAYAEDTYAAPIVAARIEQLFGEVSRNGAAP